MCVLLRCHGWSESAFQPFLMVVWHHSCFRITATVLEVDKLCFLCNYHCYHSQVLPGWPHWLCLWLRNAQNTSLEDTNLAAAHVPFFVCSHVLGNLFDIFLRPGVTGPCTLHLRCARSRTSLAFRLDVLC